MYSTLLFCVLYSGVHAKLAFAGSAVRPALQLQRSDSAPCRYDDTERIPSSEANRAKMIMVTSDSTKNAEFTE